MSDPRADPKRRHQGPLLKEKFGPSLCLTLIGHALLIAALVWLTSNSKLFQHPQRVQSGASLVAAALQARLADVRWTDTTLSVAAPSQPTLANQIPPSMRDPKNDPESVIALPLPEPKPADPKPAEPPPKREPATPVPPPQPPKPARPTPSPPAKPVLAKIAEPKLTPAPAPSPVPKPEPRLRPVPFPVQTAPIKPAPVQPSNVEPIRPAVVPRPSPAEPPRPQPAPEPSSPIRPSLVPGTPGPGTGTNPGTQQAGTVGMGSPSSSGTGGTGSGIFKNATGSGTGSSGGGNELNQYHAHVKDSYVSQWQQPKIRNSFFQKLRVRTEIVIARDGRVESARIVQQSGRADLDQSVLLALDRVRYLKPLPASVQGTTYAVILNFDL